jgi:glycerol-3-phosphate dehydrogenase
VPDVDASSSRVSSAPILILGAGINGASLARELVLNGANVLVVDRADIGSGTTAYSSRLIHGGLRYLEYGDAALVRESLEERDRLLRLAPDFVRPLEFRVPTSSRLGGFVGSVRKLLTGNSPRKPSARGSWLVRVGLGWYAWLSRSSSLPRPSTLGGAAVARMRLAPRYRQVCSYYDGQMQHAERFTAALLEDAHRVAAERGTMFDVRTYAEIEVRGATIVVRDTLQRREPFEVRPEAIVNASGPWGDRTLQQLDGRESHLLAGTKGTHLLTFQPALRKAIGEAALYVEAQDGRPVFILPFGVGTLVGTTDLPYDGDPATAVASEAELEYLIALVNGVLPDVRLTRSDVTLHYAGVRPLPRSDAAVPAAVSRRHALVERPSLPWPVWAIVGGKLTTCRSLAEEAAALVLGRLGRSASIVSRERPIPVPRDDGNDIGDEAAKVVGTTWTRGQVRRLIRREYVRRLDDLVERRLMLLFEPQLTRATLEVLASLLIEEGLLGETQREAALAQMIERLSRHFGRDVAE